MKKRFSKLGFTLIELLAVIVIIVIVLAITIPLVSNMLELVRKEAFKATAYSISDSGRFLMASNKGALGYQEFYYLDGVQYNADDKKLDYSGDGPKTGVVVLNERNQVALAIHNGTYCAIKSVNENKVTISKTTPEACTAYNIITTCDSWEQIALKYDVNIEDLLKANNVTDPNSSTCGLNIKIPISSNSSSSTTANGDSKIYYKTYYSVGYTGYNANITSTSYEYVIKLGVLPLDISDIKVVRVTAQSVFESLDDFKRYIIKKNMGEVIWPGDENPAEIDIDQASVFKDHALRSVNMNADDVIVECNDEACYATIQMTVNNMNNINPNYINGNPIAYMPVKFTVEFNGEADTCAVITTSDAVPGTLAGTGTSTDPYLVESIEDLVALSNNVNAGNTYSGKYISFANSFDFNNNRSYKDATATTFGDINGNGIVEGLKTELTTGDGFKPIGNNTTTFSGRLLGNIGCIFNLYINRPTTAYVGFIGYNNGGIIKDLTINKMNVTGGNYTGGIAGQNQGSILNTTVSGNVTGLSNVGLISGYMDGSTASSVFAEGNVVGVNSVGGIVGRTSNWPLIKGVYKSGSVVGTGSDVHRVIGYLHYGDNIGIAALNTVTVNSTIVSSKSFNNNTGLDLSSMSDLDNINLAELVLDTYIGGDNDGDGYYWDYDTSYNVVRRSIIDYPLTFDLLGAGTSANPYLVYDYNDLKQASLKNGSSYKMMADIDLSGQHYYMLGSYFNRYSGMFDGNLKTISNLTINNPRGSYVGLFGFVNEGAVQNLDLISVNINARDNVGGIIGYNEGRIMNITVSGDVTGANNVGLVNGYIGYGRSVSSVTVEGNVKGVNNVGGLIGSLYAWPTVKGVFKSGSVVGTGTNVARAIGSLYSGENVGIAALGSITVNGATVSSTYFNNNNGVNISSLSEINNINLAELVYDSYIGGDNDGDGYYWDYDASYKIIRKSVSENPLTFNLSGSGTAADPYLVYNYTDLKQATLKNGSSYKLMADINLSGQHYYMLGSYFNRYTGVFNGDNRTISNMTINNPRGSYVGFIGFLNEGSVKNINLTNVDIDASNYIAGMVGNNEGSIMNSNVTGEVTGADNVGLINGYIGYGRMASSVTAEGNVIGASNVGGMIGRLYAWPTVKGVFKSGSVIGTGSSVARAIGSLYSGENVGIAVLNSITVNGSQLVSTSLHGNHGANISSMSDLNNINLAEIVYDSYIGGDNDGDGYYWDYDDSYNIVRKSVSEYPLAFNLSGSGTAADPYIINNYNDLKQASLKNGSAYKLMSDINLSGQHYYMLGSYFNKYSGVFDGNGYTISNMTINNPKTSYVGFLGFLNGGTLKGLNLINIDINAVDYVAGLVGYNEGTIKDCNISGNINGVNNIGLVNGYLGYGRSVTSVVAEGNVSGVSNVGGIIGSLYAWPTVKAVFKSGSVTGTGSSVARTIGSLYSGENVRIVALNSILLNGSTITSTDAANTNGLDITSSDLSNTVTYTDRGFNFTDEALEYIWYLDGSTAKFRTGSL